MPLGCIILCTVQKRKSLHGYDGRTGRTGGGGWSHLQSAVCMATARLGCKRTVVGTGWAKFHPGCSCLENVVGGSGKATWALSRC